MKRYNIKELLKNHFFLHPSAKLRVRETERALKLPLPSIIRYISELKTEKILKKTKIGNVSLYSADRESKEFILEKKLFNIKRLYTSGLIEFLNFELSKPGIIVFGSYSKGEDIEGSDIDLYIESLSSKSLNLEKFEKLLKRKIQLFRHKDLKEIENKNLANNIINGIKLEGFIEVFK